MIISKFSITKVNKIYNYNIEFIDNTLILIGENGSGKSTIITIFHYVITRQWEKLTNFDFEKISLAINNEEISFTKKDLKYYSINTKPSGMRARVIDHVDTIIKNNDIQPEEIYSNESVKYEIINEVSKRYGINISGIGLDRILDDLSHKGDISSTIMSEVDKKIKQNIKNSIIFLPTYRRIERELTSIFPELEKRTNRELEYRHRHIHSDSIYSELVEFGMSDVNQIISSSASNLEQYFRTGLKALMSDFLKDILMHKHEHGVQELIEVDQIELEKILARIDTETLSGVIKDEIKTTILSLSRNESNNKSSSDKVISYFISKLVEFHRQQSDQETSINKFIETCNKYLANKKLIFNSISFEITIHPLNKNGDTILNNEIKLDFLSSGEKQIVSLFAHLYLSKRRDDYIIIIDEPELSLSVYWQKTFLEDIKKSSKCDALIAVTHSPFIYENSLDSYARSISEFMEYSA